MSNPPARYNIEALLRNSVQPFDNLPDDELRALAEGIRKGRPLAVPIVLSSDDPPILLDGHQRLRILLAQGAKTIPAADTRILRGASRANALEKAVELNVRRRHLSVEDRARVALRLMYDYGWSQRRIADACGVSQPAVSGWLTKIDRDSEGSQRPASITGLDGKRYPARQTRTPRPRSEPLDVPGPLDPEGHMTNAVRALLRDLGRFPPVPTTGAAVDHVGELLSDLADAAEALLGALEIDRR